MTASGSMHRRLDRLAKRLPPVPTCRICMYPRPESKAHIMDDHGVPLHQPYKRIVVMRGERQFTRDPEKQ